ncbi:hypothetical protein ACXZ7E_19070 [Paenibacillus lautus]
MLTTVKAYRSQHWKIIFERFIHGENKKHAVRGLALAIRSAGCWRKLKAGS